MIHVRRKRNVAVCGRLSRGDTLTEVALESDCSKCRAQLMIEPVLKDGQNVRTPLRWKAEPYPNAKQIMRSAIKNRNGK
jgi:hypothetical protein